MCFLCIKPLNRDKLILKLKKVVFELTGLIIKIILHPLLLLVANAVTDQINYPDIYQPIVTGIALAIALHLLEVMFLKRGTFWISNVVDFIAAFALVTLSQFVFENAFVSFIGGITVAAVVTLLEYFQHLYLNRTNKSRKSET